MHVNWNIVWYIQFQLRVHDCILFLNILGNSLHLAVSLAGWFVAYSLECGTRKNFYTFRLTKTSKVKFLVVKYYIYLLLWIFIKFKKFCFLIFIFFEGFIWDIMWFISKRFRRTTRTVVLNFLSCLTFASLQSWWHLK